MKKIEKAAKKREGNENITETYARHTVITSLVVFLMHNISNFKWENRCNKRSRRNSDCKIHFSFAYIDYDSKTSLNNLKFQHYSYIVMSTLLTRKMVTFGYYEKD